MVLFQFFLMIKSNALLAEDVGEAIMSNTPVFVVSAGAQMLKVPSMDAQRVSGTGIIHILIILITLMDHSSAGGIS